jgi:hypothetical protein
MPALSLVLLIPHPVCPYPIPSDSNHERTRFQRVNDAGIFGVLSLWNPLILLSFSRPGGFDGQSPEVHHALQGIASIGKRTQRGSVDVAVSS